MLHKIKVGYWLNYCERWYIVTDILKDGCKIIQVSIQEDGTYKYINNIKKIGIQALNNCRICMY